MDSEVYQGWLFLYRKAHVIKNPYKYDGAKEFEKPKHDSVEFKEFINEVDVVLGKASDYLDMLKVRKKHNGDFNLDAIRKKLNVPLSRVHELVSLTRHN